MISHLLPTRFRTGLARLKSHHAARRLAATLALLAVSTVIVFGLTELLPGDPAEIVLRRQAGGEPPSPEAVEALRREWGLDRPRLERFTRWLGHLAHGDFGTSYRTGEPVGRELAARTGRTALLALAAGLITVALSFFWGLSASRQADRLWDRVSLAATAVLTATPVFVLGLALILVFSLGLGWLPAAGASSAAHFVLPALTLGLVGAAAPARVLRRSLLAELTRPYVTAARARGADRRRVLRVHALPNAILPWLTLMGLALRGLLSGSVIVEAVFNFPGLGSYVVESASYRDTPALVACILVFVAVTASVNAATDLSYARFDPRVRLAGGAT